MAELGFGMSMYISFDLIPIALIIPDFLATGTDE